MSLPGHHDQSLKKQNDPQAVLYKLDFIHFFGRSLSFGRIFRFKIHNFSFFFKIQKSRILPNLTDKLTRNSVFEIEKFGQNKDSYQKMNKIKFVEHGLRIILLFKTLIKVSWKACQFGCQVW